MRALNLEISSLHFLRSYCLIHPFLRFSSHLNLPFVSYCVIRLVVWVRIIIVCMPVVYQEEVRDGLTRLQTLKANCITRVNGGTTESNQQITKFAPEFDGLHCFETLVVGQ